MPFDKLRRAFDKLTTNGIDRLPFVLSLSKDLIRASLRFRLEASAAPPAEILLAADFRAGRAFPDN